MMPAPGVGAVVTTSPVVATGGSAGVVGVEVPSVDGSVEVGGVGRVPIVEDMIFPQRRPGARLAVI